MNAKLIKCTSCSFQFDPIKEGNSRKRKCGMCCFGDSYSVRSKKEYERNLLFAMIESQQQKILNCKWQKIFIYTVL